MDDDAIARLLQLQDGVVARHQVLAAGGHQHDVRRLLRRREWARVHEGVYLAHTGSPTWRQRAHAAALVHHPAALAGRSALVVHGLAEPDDAPIEVLVDRSRRVVDPPGVTTRQVRDLAAVALLHLSPPRVRVEHAVLDVASRARTEDRAVAVVADAVQQRRTTPSRLRDALAGQPRLPRRALLAEVLADVAEGAWSALERRYLRDVERRHGLPTSRRQVRAGVGTRAAYRDVVDEDHGLVVELDGRLGHERRDDVWDDLDRDIDAVEEGLVTVRVAWRQVLSPCVLAARLGRLLRARGWAGTVLRCGPDCPVDREVPDQGGTGSPGGRVPRPSAPRTSSPAALGAVTG